MKHGAMPWSEFLGKPNCDRCHKPFEYARILSWFTEDVLCLDCEIKEDSIKKALREQGKDPLDYEGCGYIPTVSKAPDIIAIPMTEENIPLIHDTLKDLLGE